MAHTSSTDDLYSVAVPGAPTLAPDGTRAVYTVRTVSRDDDRDEHCLWVLDVDSGARRRLTDGPGDSAPVWSPDGRRFAWFDHDEQRSRLWAMDPDEPENADCLVELMPGASALRWSPDGTQLSFLVPVDLASQLGQLSTVNSHAPIVANTLEYKADGFGRWGTVRIQPHTISATGGAPRRLVDDDRNYTGLEWHPNSTSLLAVAAGEADSDLTGASSVYELATSGAQPSAARLVAFGDGLAAHAQWLRDASAMLVVGTETTGSEFLQLLLVNPDGSVQHNLGAPLDRTIQSGDVAFAGTIPQELDDGRILFSVNDAGVPILYRVALDGGDPELLRGHGEEGWVQVSAASGRLAGIVRTPRSLGELSVFTTAGDELHQTDHGGEFWNTRTTVIPIAREFALTSGSRVPGWVLRDPDASTPGPLLVDIHGGPHSSWSPLAADPHWYRNVLVEAGWTVLLINPPASEGYGEEFFHANVGAWGHGDQAAFLEPIEQLVAEGIADESRLVVMGYSYGGYATCWLTSQTDRFAAAIAGGVVSDLTSLISSDLSYPELYADLSSTPWESPEVLDAQSPFTFVDNVTTPTLVLHGAADDRCPVNQGEQWFTALRARGVPTEMVVYPGASHLMILNGRPSHRADYQRRIVEWASRFTTAR